MSTLIKHKHIETCHKELKQYSKLIRHKLCCRSVRSKLKLYFLFMNTCTNPDFQLHYGSFVYNLCLKNNNNIIKCTYHSSGHEPHKFLSVHVYSTHPATSFPKIYKKI